MRRIVALLAALAFLSLVSIAPASASTTSSLNGRFALFWPRPADAPRNAPCDPGVLCGPGQLADFGPATITIENDSFDDSGNPNCFDVQHVETVHLLDGSGDLVLKGTGTVCWPGHSINSQDQSSYGNPTKWSFDFIVKGSKSTGVFSGATGSGHESFMFAGAVGKWALSGAVVTS